MLPTVWPQMLKLGATSLQGCGMRAGQCSLRIREFVLTTQALKSAHSCSHPRGLATRSGACAEHIETQVLIVGAGPVGTYMSLLLSRYGITSLVVDRSLRSGDHGLGHAGVPHPRAHVLNTRTMELLREIGLDSEVQQTMPPAEQWRSFRYCTSLLGSDIAHVDHFDNMDGAYENLRSNSPTHVAHLSQPFLEEMLQRSAKKHTHLSSVMTQCELTELSDSGPNVRSTIQRTSSDGRREAVHVTSAYVVGCDGAHSAVRRLSGIQTSGTRGVEHFMSVHFRSQDLWSRMRGRAAMLYFIFNPDVLACLVAHDLNKGEWVAQIPFFPPVQASGISLDSCTKLVAACIGSCEASSSSHQAPAPTFEVCSAKAWSMDGAVAETFQKGRILLAGDAAHQFPPSGGFGLNTGLQDAHNLAWKLAEVVRDRAPPSLLSTYSSERIPVAKVNSDLSVDNHRRGLLVPEATGLRREWLAAAIRSVREGPLGSFLPVGVVDQALETAIGAGQMPFALLETADNTPKHQKHQFTGGLLKLVRTLVGVPWTRKMQEVVESRAALPLLFPKHDIGFKYPPSEAVYLEGGIPPEGSGGASPLYTPSGAPGGRVPHVVLEGVRDGCAEEGSEREIQHVSTLDLVASTAHVGVTPSHVLVVFGSGGVADQWVEFLSVRHWASRPEISPSRWRMLCVESGEGEPQKGVWKDVDGKFASVCGVSKGGAILVRPDGHIAWRSRDPPVAGQAHCEALLNWLEKGVF